MDLIKTAIYPYRLCMTHSFYKVYLPDNDYQAVADLLFEMKKNGELLKTVDFNNQLKIIHQTIELNDLQAVDDAYGNDPMYIEDRAGKYEASAYAPSKHKEKKEEPRKSAAQYSKKRSRK